MIARRQSKRLRNRRLRAVKRGVEAGDLEEGGLAFRHDSDRGEVVRLVKRGERDEPVEGSEHIGVDPDR